MKYFFITIGVLISLIIAGLIVRSCNAATGVFSETVNSENIISSYENFEDMFATCQQICSNIETVKSDTTTTAGFSQQQRINALNMQLSRWVNQYNADSHKFRKEHWKRSDLPYQLSIQTICNN